MRPLLIGLAGLLFTACGEQQPEPLYLTKEFYEWHCADYEFNSEIIVTTQTCETRETGLHYLIAELHLVEGDMYKRHLTRNGSECDWQTEFILIEDVCMSVDGVTLTAYVDPATWTGALFGD